MAQPTPGPWYLYAFSTASGSAPASSGSTTMQGYSIRHGQPGDADFRPIARVTRLYGDTHPEEVEANALAIVALPDLLHAAQMLVDWWASAYPMVGIRGCWICQPGGGDDDHFEGCPIPFAQSAIEKAVPDVD